MAKPSLSHMSCQDSGVTESPYHWWDSSCTKVLRLTAGGEPSPGKTGRFWVSSEYPTRPPDTWSTIAPADAKG